MAIFIFFFKKKRKKSCYSRTRTRLVSNFKEAELAISPLTVLAEPCAARTQPRTFPCVGLTSRRRCHTTLIVSEYYLHDTATAHWGFSGPSPLHTHPHPQCVLLPPTHSRDISGGQVSVPGCPLQSAPWFNRSLRSPPGHKYTLLLPLSTREKRKRGALLKVVPENERALFQQRVAVLGLSAGWHTREWNPRPPLPPPLHSLSSHRRPVLLRAQPSCFSSSSSEQQHQHPSERGQFPRAALTSRSISRTRTDCIQNGNEERK